MNLPKNNSAFDRETFVFQDRENRLITERLEIAPLTRTEIESLISNPVDFAAQLGLDAPPEPLNDETASAFEWLIEQGLSLDSYMSVYAAVWAIVERNSRRCVGFCCFKGAPIEREAEIGYGTDLPFRNRGFMTEAVRALVRWAKNRPELDALVAESLNANRASARVLEKAGFVPSTQNDPDALFWRARLS